MLVAQHASAVLPQSNYAVLLHAHYVASNLGGVKLVSTSFRTTQSPAQLTLGGTATASADYVLKDEAGDVVSTLPSITIEAGEVSGLAVVRIDPVADDDEEVGDETDGETLEFSVVAPAGISTVNPAELTLLNGSRPVFVGPIVEPVVQAPTEARAASKVTSDDRRVSKNTVVLANAWSATDVAIAALLAARIPGSVVLYADDDELGDDAETLLDERDPPQVTVIGDADAVSDDTAQAAAKAGGSQVGRISGATAAEKAAAAARLLLGDPDTPARRTLIVVNCASPADVSAAVALAARTPDSAVLCTDPDAMPDATRSVIADYQPAEVVIIGGTAVAGDEVEAAARAAAPATELRRIAGATRVDTAAALARAVLDGVGDHEPRTVIVVNGWSTADVAAAAALAARTRNAVVVFATADGLPQATWAVISDYQPSNVVIVGGAKVVPLDVEGAVADAAPRAKRTRLAGTDRLDTAAQTARLTLR